jgi:pyruvate formate lyase activating enzyme
LIPGFNESEHEKLKIVNFIRSLEKDVRIEYLKYHELGKFKYDLLGRKYDFQLKKYKSV